MLVHNSSDGIHVNISKSVEDDSIMVGNLYVMRRQ